MIYTCTYYEWCILTFLWWNNISFISRLHCSCGPWHSSYRNKWPLHSKMELYNQCNDGYHNFHYYITWHNGITSFFLANSASKSKSRAKGESRQLFRANSTWMCSSKLLLCLSLKFFGLVQKWPEHTLQDENLSLRWLWLHYNL